MSTIVIKEHSFHERGRREENRDSYCANDLPGGDFISFIVENLPTGKTYFVGDRAFRVEILQRLSETELLIVALAGPKGLPGALFDQFGNVTRSIGRSDTAAHSGRILVIAPERSLNAYSFFERHPGNAPGLDVFKHLRKNWSRKFNKVTWSEDWCQFGNEFLAASELKAIEIRKKNQTVSFEGRDISLGRKSISIVPPRGGFLPHNWLERITRREISAHDIVHWKAEEDDEQVLDLRGPGDITKRYVVERGDLPKLQVKVDNDLSDKDFTNECRTLFDQISPTV